jgi:transposase
MDRRKASAQVQRLEVVELGRRRRWSAEAKLRIVEESFTGWRQASARRRWCRAQLSTRWRSAMPIFDSWGRREGVKAADF